MEIKFKRNHFFIRIIALTTAFIFLFSVAAIAEVNPAYSEIDGEHISNQVLVKFSDNLPSEGDVGRTYGKEYTVDDVWDFTNTALISSSSASTEQLISLFGALDYVEYAEPNNIYEAESISDEPYLSEQWALENTDGTKGFDINPQVLWDKGVTGSEDVVVALLDTGVDYTHPDLVDNMWVNTTGVLKGTCGYNFTDEKNATDPMDEDGHGTHCAGIITGSGGISGVCKNIKIMALEVLSEDGSSDSDILGAYEYMLTAVKLGVNVVAANCSWGSNVISKSLYDAINKVGEAGIVSVFAAGNDALNNDYSTSSPAALDSPYIISVAATDKNGSLAYFSDYGSTSVDVAAPGVNILSTVPKSLAVHQSYLSYLDGTSVAYTDGSMMTDLSFLRTNELTSSSSVSFARNYTASTNKSVLWKRWGPDPEKLYYEPNIDVLKIDKDSTYYFGFTAALAGSNVSVDANLYIKTTSGDYSLIGNLAMESSFMTGTLTESVNYYELPTNTDWENFSIQITAGKGTGLYLDKIGVGQNLHAYDYYSGTSMAAPAITGAYALLYSYNEEYHLGWSDDEIEARVLGGTNKSQPGLVGKTLSDGYFDFEYAVNNPDPVPQNVTEEDGTYTLTGYFFGDIAGTLTANNKACTIKSWSDEKIVFTVDGIIGIAGITVNAIDSRSGRGSLDFGNYETKYTELSVPVSNDESYIYDDLLYYNLETDGDHIYYVGGTNMYNTFLGITVYDIATNTWVADKTTVGFTEYCSSCLFNDKIYITDYGSCEDQIVVYDCKTEAIENYNIDVPNDCDLFVYNGQIYLFGGYFSDDSDNTSFYTVNPDTCELTNVNDLAYAEMYDSSYEVVSNKLVVMSGYGTVDIINLDTGRLTSGASFPTVKNDQQTYCATAACENGVIVCGMVTLSGYDTMYYNINENKWYPVETRLSQYKTAVSDAVCTNGFMYIMSIAVDAKYRFSELKLSDVGLSSADEINYGDVNFDGYINYKDVLLIRQYIAAWNVSINTKAADCNADGITNSKDVLLLRKYIAEYDITLG